MTQPCCMIIVSVVVLCTTANGSVSPAICVLDSWTRRCVSPAVPIAVLGAFIAVAARGLAQDIYFQIGLLTLVGLSAKNAILIVEFCVDQVRQGRPPVEAALEAARLRFRPIVMTSMAFILGVVPLAISSGAGAAARHSIRFVVHV